ncbi:hypothetical protein QUW48_00560 [Bifidobacterium pullorum]|uniref:hypothetical protein n=1 Tax=Bifidobacterium pullorum TaxID=78448 RepID=UPI0025A40034|nr:hypothetical protein [Bifidobacterium pullorum]MDM8322060.1 hypothetical protein [Bifidobacterium pullorum]
MKVRKRPVIMGVMSGLAVSILITITVALAGLILSPIVPGMLGQLSDAGLTYPGA